MLDQLLQQASLSLQSSDFQQALKLSQQALDIAPQHPNALFIHAIALGNTQQLSAAVEIMNGLIQAYPNNPEMHYNLGLIYQVNEQPLEAIQQYQQSLKYQPQHLMALNNLALQLEHVGNFSSAVQHLQSALQLSPGNPGITFNLAHALHNNQQPLESIGLLDSLIQGNQTPIEVKVLLLKNHMLMGQYQTAYRCANDWSEHPVCLFYMGLAAIKMFKYPLAIQALEQYQQKVPTDPSGQMNLALSLAYAGQTSEADQILDSLLTAAEDNIELMSFGARFYDMRNLTDRSAEFITRGLELDPTNHFLLTLEASHARKAKNYTQALDNIQKALEHSQDVSEKSASLFEKGKTLDSLGEYQTAWQAFSQANSLISKKTDGVFLTKLKQEKHNILNQNIRLKPLKPSDHHRHIFVMGFPRSGTTLIDSILNSYSETTVLEEVPILDHLSEQLIGSQTDSGDRLEIIAQLDTASQQQWRQRYFEQLSDYIDWDHNKILINKSPLNIIHLPLIRTLFPTDPVIVVIRHPLDSVLSCFTQNFQSHALLGDVFSDLELTTQAYDVLMGYWKSCHHQLDIPCTTIQYERMVSDFDSESKRLIKACGLTWHNQLDAFYRTNKERAIIQNPSSDQVNQPLYTSSLFRHKNYAEQLKDSADALKPWIEFFNY